MDRADAFVVTEPVNTIFETKSKGIYLTYPGLMRRKKGSLVYFRKINVHSLKFFFYYLICFYLRDNKLYISEKNN